LQDNHGDNSLGAGIAAFVAGLVAMYFAYRRYRYGEHYEYRRRYAGLGSSAWSASMPDSVRQVGKILRALERS